MGLVANVVIATSTHNDYFSPQADTNPLLHTWSLSVEEQFYLIFPALILLGWKLARNRRRYLGLNPVLLITAIGLISFALAVTNSRGVIFPGFQRILGFYSPVTRVWEFAAGALLAIVLTRWSPASPRLCQSLGIAGLALAVVSTLAISERTPFPGMWTLLPVVSTLLLILAGTRPTGRTYQFLSSHPMTRIGDWSYSIYLWHWPFIAVAGLVWPRNPAALIVAAATSLVPAISSYRRVEKPIRNLSGLTTRRWISLVLVVLLVPALLGSALWFAAAHGWWSQSVRRLQSATIPLHVASVAGCDERRPLSAAVAAQCSWNNTATGEPIYLVGDSNSTQFSEGTITAGKDLGRPVIIAAAVACPFVNIFMTPPSPTPMADMASCRRYFEESLEYLKQAARGLVVIANIDTYWPSQDYKVGESRDTLSTDPKRKMEALSVGLRETVDTLRNSGHRVLLVQTIPHLDFDPSRCSLLTIVRSHCTDDRSMDNAIKPGLAARKVLEDVAAKSGAAIWDPVIPLCPDKLCSTQTPEFVRYRDRAHISVPQSINLAPEIRTAIASAGK